MRPDVGTQAQFRKKQPPRTYRYDSSLSPALEWDGQNPAREQGEAELAAATAELAEIRARLAEAEEKTDGGNKLPDVSGQIARVEEALRRLRALGEPFLNWAGKAERLSFDVPTLPLFVHERLSTKAIVETLKGHKADKQQSFFEMFGDPQHSITNQVLRAYEYQDKWVNRMVLGDSLVVMNSLLRYESLGGQVQMIYMDPPYGVKFGSNFQPFVRKRDVRHGEDGDMTREPEMVQAYRDTWELGLHSYLTYLRDRLLLCRDLLHPSGSIFVQISDENLHHVRELMDEVFGAENFCSVITFLKTAAVSSPQARTNVLGSLSDYLLWYAKDVTRVKYNQPYAPKMGGDVGEYTRVELPDGTRRPLTRDELRDFDAVLESGGRLYRQDNIISTGYSESLSQPFEFGGDTFRPGATSHWKTTLSGMETLAKAGRLERRGAQLSYVRYLLDFPVTTVGNLWDDVLLSSRSEEKQYVVQTSSKVVQRCILMTTDPGDLVFDPTCGSGTTAYVAEQWGRRWITADTSRVPLALARQRLLTATFPYYELKDEAKGPASGFIYKRKQNKKGEEVGGIVPHITLKSIANNEPPAEEVLVDRPEVKDNITRVTGPFCVEATIPTPVDWEGDGQDDGGDLMAETHGSFVDRMLEVLRRSPILRLEGNRSVTFKNVRPPARTLTLTAEAVVEATAHGQAPTVADAVQEAHEKNATLLPLSQQPVAFVFGPENGAVSEKLVFEAAREAHAKSYTHLYVLGFAIEPNARELIENCAEVVGVPSTYVQATPDLMMGDLLKNMRSSHIFSVVGLPEIKVHEQEADGRNTFQVELLGFDVFDPATTEVEHRKGDDVPAWLLDSDYNDLCFHVCQAFFPRTGAWENLKRALKGEYEEGVWDHLAGTLSAPFEAGDRRRIAVKVIDDRGNELLVVKDLKGASR
jgi:adenine-specific DNA-methyltransferase